MALGVETADCDLPVPGGPCLAHTNKSFARETNKSGDAVRATRGLVRWREQCAQHLNISSPAQPAIIIMGCLFVFLSALWAFVITKAMIAIGIGAMALFIAGACASLIVMR